MVFELSRERLKKNAAKYWSLNLVGFNTLLYSGNEQVKFRTCILLQHRISLLSPHSIQINLKQTVAIRVTELTAGLAFPSTSGDEIKEEEE